MKKLSLKQSKWVNEAARTLNPTEAARKSYNTKNNNVAKSIASENLTKPYLRAALELEMEKVGMDDKEIAEIHARNIKQSENISASNSALDLLYKIKGYYAPEKQAVINLSANLSVDEIDKRIKEITEELKSLE